MDLQKKSMLCGLTPTVTVRKRSKVNVASRPVHHANGVPAILNFSTQFVGYAPCGDGKIERLTESSSAPHGCPHCRSQAALLAF
jgi:hypothetical protein